MVFYSAADSGCLNNVLIVDSVPHRRVQMQQCQMLQ